ncbi:MAG: outer membrane beta-barrel protein [Alistipes sp.]|nr:outer membrane beta-barrel protein [Alistipes sp.]
MKRNTLLLLAAAILFGRAAHAQLYIDKNPENGASAVAPTTEPTERTRTSVDTLRRIDPTDSEVVRLREADKEGNMLLEINGLGLTLGRSYESRTWDDLKKRRFALTFASDIELGFTSLLGVKYDRPHETAPDFLNQTLGCSFHFGFAPVGISMRLDKKRRSHLNLGMSYSVDNIRLTNPAFTVRNDGNRLVPVELDEPAEKSKLRYTTLGLVLRYDWRPVDKLRISVSTHYDFLMNGYAITKKPKEKTALSGFAPFRFGVGASVGYRYVGVFVRYAPTSLFQSSSGLKAQTLSYGLVFNF